MKIILCILFLLVSADISAQSDVFTISENNVPLKRIIRLIERTNKYSFTYTKELIDNKRVTVHVEKKNIHEVLKQALSGLLFTYVMHGDSMVVIQTAKTPFPITTALISIQGKVLNEISLPLEGVSVWVQKGGRGTVTNEKGEFALPNIPFDAVLYFSSVGYESGSLPVNGQLQVEMRLKAAAVKSMDETIIIGYGKTSKRLNTGSVHKISSGEISKQPVSNPLAAMQSLVPGLLITQSNGLPGTTFKVQLRGQSSIGVNPGKLPPNDPLFIIDGVPFAPNNNPLQILRSGTSLGSDGRSPFAVINPADIESIEILKDADATAIYGSRGANGVILFTTKKGKVGKPVMTANVYSGFSTITRHIDMLGTRDYVRMRRIALENDGLVADSFNAPDLVVWDTTRSTNFKDLLIGNTASVTNLQLSLSGGTDRLQYLIGTGFNHQTTVFPGDLSNNRASVHTHLRHQSKDNKFSAAMTVLYSYDKNNSITKDLTEFIDLPPNAPALYDADGKLNWESGGTSFVNPMAYLKQPYEAKTGNILTGLDVSYRLNKKFTFKTSLGYNSLSADELAMLPRVSHDTFTSPDIQGYSYFGNSIIRSYIVEPQLEYVSYIGKSKFSLMAGATYQRTVNRITSTLATGFSSEDALRFPHSAENLDSTKFYSEYRYASLFARLQYQLNDAYILNLTARRDGSSRFGTSKSFGNFGALGAAWIFSNEGFVKQALPFVSFGKLRGSYGLIGNDQIGDYKYMDLWSVVPNNYLGNPGLAPIQLVDSNYSWEVSHKLELAIELGILNDQIQLTTAYYRNRNGNQLIAYPLPSVTGFTKYEAKNSSAVVQNRGFELSLRLKSKPGKCIEWMNSFSVTIPRNELLSFPRITTSDYAEELMTGQSLSVRNGFRYSGINCTNCLFTFEDVDGDGEINYLDDYRVIGNIDPKWYGNITNSLRYRNWQLDLLWEIRKQTSYSYLQGIYERSAPGMVMKNQPVNIFNNIYQGFSTGGDPAARQAIDDFLHSDGVLADASFVRLRNIALSFSLPTKWQQKFSLKGGRIYFQAQNLLTFTKYFGIDPETQNIKTLPPLKIITGGIELSF